MVERQIERELKEAETKAHEEARKGRGQQFKEHVKAEQTPPRIRPLSGFKAIETGANFISETFVFLVTAEASVFKSWRPRDGKGSITGWKIWKEKVWK